MNINVNQKKDGSLSKAFEAVLFLVVIHISYWIGFRIRFGSSYLPEYIESFLCYCSLLNNCWCNIILYLWCFFTSKKIVF